MYNQYTRLQQEIINDLAAIEKQDQEACDNCGGEDCICCGIYLDRQQWKSPDELFAG
jgi:hypothetical protein